jgi:hypothetical protein
LPHPFAFLWSPVPPPKHKHEPEAPVVSDLPVVDGTIDRLDQALDALIGPTAVVENVAEGFRFVERPVWMPENGG